MSLYYHTHTLANRMRIIHVPSPSKVTYCGVAVNAGSRDDLEGKSGLAHFVEHTIFKGTKHRRSWHILNRMERVGGEMNAYTTKEGTMLYSIFPQEHIERAIELMSDLIANSIFPDNELSKEREVVMDEVDSYRDTPSEAVYDDFEDLLFSGSALGHNILGTEEDLRHISAADCRNYLDTQYVPENMILFVYGDMRTQKIFRIAEKHFGMLSHPLQRAKRQAPTFAKPFRQTIAIGSHQSHTVIGAPLFPLYDERRFAMSLLNNMLGGTGMNSLLNVAMRERHAYVYTVEASVTLLSDCGFLEIYFGSDSKHVRPSLSIFGNIIEELATKPLSGRALDNAKRQYVGQLLVSTDNREATAMSIGKSFLYFDKLINDDEVSERIKALSSQEIMDAASLITLPKCSILTME